jgi:hypothetical protein
VLPALCHSERSEESSAIPPRLSAAPNWILHFVQNDKLGFALHADKFFFPALASARRRR